MDQNKTSKVTVPSGNIAKGNARPANRLEYSRNQLVMPPRQLREVVYHPNGGCSAKVAAEAVLAERGMPSLVPLEDSRNPEKLAFFFKPGASKQESKKQAPQAPSSGYLAKWRARPWEEDETATVETPLNQNTLSLSSSRGSNFAFARR